MSMKRFPWKIIFYTSMFAIAMGFLETSVVIYLRALLYPKGFSFPLASMTYSLALTEILREGATIIMLLCIGYVTGTNRHTRFAYFLYSFAIWDIFYYVFLKLLIQWPDSFLTWDILFLIPTNWVGPVIAPLIVSFTMIWFAVLIIWFDSKPINVRMNFTELSLIIAGSLILILAFIWDYSGFILNYYSFKALWSVPAKDLLFLSYKYIPVHFNWLLFTFAELTIVSGIFIFYLKNLNRLYIEKKNSLS